MDDRAGEEWWEAAPTETHTDKGRGEHKKKDRRQRKTPSHGRSPDGGITGEKQHFLFSPLTHLSRVQVSHMFLQYNMGKKKKK